MANDNDDNKMSRSEAASKAGQSQGKEDNPGNFANRSEQDRKEAAAKGGEHSHSGGRKSDEG